MSAYIKRLLLTSLIAASASCSEQNKGPAIGFVDLPLPGSAIARQLNVAGWALDPDGIEAIGIELNGTPSVTAEYGMPRQDVARLYPNIAGSLHSGFNASLSLPAEFRGNVRVAVIVRDRHGNQSELGSVDVLVTGRSPWRDLLDQRPALRQRVFYLPIATSGIANGGAAEIKDSFQNYESETIKIAMRAPLLYMRTTKGRENDWAFDADFNVSTSVSGKIVAEDSLNGLLSYSIREELPILVTLNGGIWADARGPAVEWDINDALEEDPVNCQWNEDGEVMPDDYLSKLPGSESSPQLARALTLNIYATAVRHYKKRNLQSAGSLIRRFADTHPDLFVGATLDPDVYINPFFLEDQWYDYNPDTLRQFREWLSGSGSYAKDGRLSRYRRGELLNLAELSSLSGRQFDSWDTVQPPKPSSFGILKPYWKDPYVALWQQYQRHLVDLHYDELSLWLNQAGIPREKIFSAQGFAIAESPMVDILPVHVNSPARNYNAGGVSVEGAAPSHGHLGAILYGKGLRDDVIVETGDDLLGALKKADRDWAVVEFNPSFLEYPSRLADYRDGYTAMQRIFNFGARFASPMAWNGWNGIYADQPGYLAYTSFRNTPFESAIQDFMLLYADLPRTSILWPFGSWRHSDTDGWTVSEPFEIDALPGRLVLRPNGRPRELVLESPPRQVIETRMFDTLILGIDKTGELDGKIYIDARSDSTGAWVEAVASADTDAVQDGEAGILMPLGWTGETPELASQLRVRWQNKSDFRSDIELRHIALYPAADPPHDREP